MKKTNKWLMVSALFTSLVFAGCSSQPSASEGSGGSTAAGGDKKIVIGFSQVTSESPFYTALVDGAKAEAAKQGAELVVMDAQNDIEKQNADVQDLITKGIDVLILNPTNPTAVVPALTAAKQANIQVVTVDRPTEEKVAAFVGRDNKEMGRIAGKQAVALLGGEGKATGKVIELQGDAGGKVMMDRHDGFHEIVSKEPGVKIVEGPYSDYIRSKAVKAFQDLLQANPDVNLVYAHNDDMALGALQVLEQANMLDKVKIVGIDGLSEAVKAIIDGKYSATVFNDPIKLGSIVVDTALKVAKGEQVPEYVDGGTGLIDASNAKDVYNEKDVFAQMK
ncbi:substrate-binding domain-containing protein [Brevibacillus brevis]|uniref:Substrate-binding domain-containing protein n=1 Tax=Brevibacillus brevis TaxID=1393 RepID=A0ABY9T6G7_BREBE|nr:substrate-binding domain-containing protein [Brevibacillus brevis]WNC15641.1 substrate-binding domain-containing protein [Brevibacillus brevis]